MLKNKNERREFLEDDKNWKMIYQLKDLGIRYYRMDFSDGTSFIRIDRYGYSWMQKKDIFQVESYEILENGKMTHSSMSNNIDYIMRRELKETNEKSIEKDDYDIEK